MTDHDVNFGATQMGLYASCKCGWYHNWTPWSHISDYAVILKIGLEHVRGDEPLPVEPDEWKPTTFGEAAESALDHAKRSAAFVTKAVTHRPRNT